MSTTISDTPHCDRAQLARQVEEILDATPAWDLHTHLYPASFGTPLAGTGASAADPKGLMLWGIDELLTYHYLVAEVFRVVPSRVLPYADFWQMSKQQQADHIWQHLFLERTPLSEACRGVLTTLQRLGLDPADKDLDGYRQWFAQQDPNDHVDRVMQASGVCRITMTNDVFDDNERQRWLTDPAVGSDSRFAPVLRFDPLLCDWPSAARQLSAWGYRADENPSPEGIAEVRRFLSDWLDRTGAIYCAVSLPPTFRYNGLDDTQVSSVIFREAVLPTLAERNLAMALMIGVVRGVNPRLSIAGDGLEKADVSSICRLCTDFPDNRFMVTLLSRENQHELAVAARKFDNLLPFGCWWFLNNPSIIEEMTRVRMELLGTSFAPQHSDARVLEQIVYKWSHSREIIAKVLADKYADIIRAGWPVSEDDMRRDAKLLLHDNFQNFVAGR